MMTVYKTEEIAERAREIVEKFFQMETKRIHDSHLEGTTAISDLLSNFRVSL